MNATTDLSPALSPYLLLLRQIGTQDYIHNSDRAIGQIGNRTLASQIAFMGALEALSNHTPFRAAVLADVMLKQDLVNAEQITPIVTGAITSSLDDKTSYHEARRLSQYLEISKLGSLPGVDATVAEHLPRYLPWINPLELLGGRMPLLLALDLPQVHKAGASLLCQWFDENQTRALNTHDLQLLGHSVRDHFEALGKRHETWAHEAALCRCAIDFLVAARPLPFHAKNNLFQAVSDVQTWRKLQSTFWRCIDQREKAKINAAIYDIPQIGQRKPRSSSFVAPRPIWPKEKTSPRPGKSL